MSAKANLELLNDPVAQTLLNSKIPARLAYNWKDGTPRFVPIWFHWNGSELVFGTPVTAPKAQALKDGDKVAVTIDSTEWPPKVLLIRGSIRVQAMDNTVPEYALSAERYFGPEQGRARVKQAAQLSPRNLRIALTPEHVDILDFEKRYPSAFAKAMAAMK